MDGVSVLREEQVPEEAPAVMFPGFRFSPTDEELISYYLKKKLEGLDKCVEVIADIDFCKFEPWDLPAKSIVHSDTEWFFFSARGRKYPNGSQSRRATRLGYWKATGKERHVKSGANVIGTKRTLVFHTGRAPKGERTEWIVHEYCIACQSQDSMVVCRLRKNADFRLSGSRARACQGRRKSSGMPDGNDCGFPSGQTNGVESSSRKSCSSNDSHSDEQIDSAFEVEGKRLNDFVVPKSPERQKDSGDEEDCYEDCYADVLKDDIINLDEPALSCILDQGYSEGTYDPSFQSTMTTAVPSQATLPLPDSCPGSSEPTTETAVLSSGTAYRRIGLESRLLQYSESVDLSPKCVKNGLKTSHCIIYVVLVILTGLALCCGSELKEEFRVQSC